MFFCELCKFLRTFFDRIPADDCFLCLSVNFQRFCRTPYLQSTSGKQLISCSSYRISTSRYSKNYFTIVFQAFYKGTRSSHSKVFIYLKSLKISFMYFAFIFSECITITTSVYIGFESVRAQFLSAIIYSLVPNRRGDGGGRGLEKSPKRNQPWGVENDQLL